MTMDGTCGNQKVPNKNGDECDFGSDHQQSISLRDSEVNVPSDSKVFKTSWFKKDRIQKGTLEYTRNDEHGCIDVCRTQENCFNATVLKKVTLTVVVRKSIQSHNTFTQNLRDFLKTSGAGDVYEEFFPRNDLLCDPTKYLPTVVELLRIHAELCHFNKCDYVFYNWWLDHFYRGELSLVSGQNQRKNSPPQVSSRPCISILKVTREGELAAFIAFWLSHLGCYTTVDFRDGCITSKGQRLSLLPAVLGYIYHGLRQAASHPDHPVDAGATLPIHYVIAELFPRLYSHRPDHKCLKEYPTRGLAEILLIWGCRVMIFSISYSLSSICWLSSKIEEIFGIVESVAQIEESVDIDRGQLDNLSNEASNMRLKEQEILKEEERINKIREDLTRAISLDLKKKEAEQVKADLAEARFPKLQDLDKEKDYLKNLIGSVISFNNV
ncbi:LOW QUALITY PROTEIN: hypothetical protein Cgig2_023108 [Carnegiea gigantea]|uniref:Aminotransferase-like plant mobile domain-containing protein n=1 Tax=Carnegiea gigantea TaxID=171969 RepID=A0A9Q1JKM7_9CARY|nr:LOW QUALITY PROTEIN: hypothetical protein Cgig2_023108 [Carnegiea gigantea]